LPNLRADHLEKQFERFAKKAERNETIAGPRPRFEPLLEPAPKGKGI